MPSRRKTGGGAGHAPGLPVNNIEAFLPSLIPDIALWIKAETNFIKEEIIASYANKQSYFRRTLKKYSSAFFPLGVTWYIRPIVGNRFSFERTLHVCFPLLTLYV